MSVKCQAIIEALEQWAPRSLAEDWDNVGLMLGSPAQDIERVMVALDVMPEVVEQAIAAKVDLLVVHHPVIFKPLKHLRSDQPHTALLVRLIQAGIAVYAAHTNLDCAPGGVNDVLAEQLGLQEVKLLAASGSEALYKIVVFVPHDQAAAVHTAMAEAGAGHIGQYSHCSFQTKGEGTFLPLDGAEPYIGRVGTLERVEEVRLETIVPQSGYRRVLRAMLAVHPYEEVAYDIYKLENEGQSWGLGRIGRLPAPLSFAAFCQDVKTRLGCEAVMGTGAPETQIRKVAVCGGSGASLLHKAAFAGADVLVTGDVKYHEAQAALLAGVAIVDASHFATEVPVLAAVVRFLETMALQKKWNITVQTAEQCTNMWSVY